MLLLRKIARLVGGAVCIAALAAPANAQSRPAILVTESAGGVQIRASSGALPNARVLRLSNPDRLVLDFDQTELRMSAAQRAICDSHGVRVGFHEETATTRVVFDIPAGQQRWLKLEPDAVLVEYRSLVQKGGASSEFVAFDPTANRPSAPVESPRRRVVETLPTAAHSGINRSEVSRVQKRREEEPLLRVTTTDGLLQVSAHGVPFKAILDKVADAAGASVQMMTPVEDGQRQIFEYGPAPPMEVIRKLFEGSNYNYLVVSEPNSTTRISRIVVTSALHYLPGNDGPVADDDSNPEALQGITPITPKPDPAEKRPN